MSRLALLVLLGACSDGGGQCRAVAPVGGAGIAGTVMTDQITYGRFTSSPNNDCPAGGGVISVTISAEQTGPEECSPSCSFNLCLPRPDLIGEEPISLADTSLVRVDTLAARVGPCLTLRADAPAPTGTATFRGFCTTSGTEWVLALDGSVAVTRTCGLGPTVETTIALGGEADVASL